MERKFRVDSTMISTRRYMREADILREFQQSGIDHLDAVNHGLEVMEELHEAYLLCRNSVRIHRLPRYGEELSALTCTPRYDGLFDVRYYALRDKTGEFIADSCSYWSLFDTKRMHIVRPTQSIDSYMLKAESFKVSAPVPTRLTAPEGMEKIADLKVTHSLIDQYGHINNTRYVDLLRDFLPEDVWISELTMNYNTALPLGAEFSVMTDGKGCYTFNRKDRTCFIALVKTEKLDLDEKSRD